MTTQPTIPTILFVDDSEDQLQLWRDQLNFQAKQQTPSPQITILAAQTNEQALALFRQHQKNLDAIVWGSAALSDGPSTKSIAEVAKTDFRRDRMFATSALPEAQQAAGCGVTTTKQNAVTAVLLALGT